MKKMRKVLALVVAMVMVLAMAVTGYAADGNVTITISRDMSYDSNASGIRDYTYYKVFDATYTDQDNVSYTLNASNELVKKLGTWDGGAWTRAEGNQWFNLTLSADGETYIVKATDGFSAEDAATAAAWLLENGDLTGTAMAYTSESNEWKAVVEKGYYIVQGSEGANLIAATTNINMREKNTYPTIDKKQADEDNSTMTDDAKKIAVGDVINYQVTVYVPSDTNQDIIVTDTMSTGLTYGNDLIVKVGETVLTANTDYEVATAGDSESWKVTIKPTENTLGKDVVFNFSATVNSGALADTTKANTVELNYNNNHYVVTDKVEFETYYTGIEKVDGQENDTKLEGVKFTLKEGNAEFKVSKSDGKDYYVPDANGSSEVVTDGSGQIKIRGLDGEKTYTLTETYTLDGYNLLDEEVILVLKLDSAEDIPAGSTFHQVVNNKGSVLPSTGGIGTTIIYVVGTILVLGAAILLVTKRRMKEER